MRSFLIDRKVQESVGSFYAQHESELTHLQLVSLNAYLRLNEKNMIRFVIDCVRYNWNLGGSRIKLILKALFCKRFVK